MGTRRRHTPEQIIRKLTEAERLLGEGRTIPEVTKAVEPAAMSDRSAPRHPCWM